MVSIDLTLNDRAVRFDAPAQMPLLWALRDVVGLTGTKYGCGVAQCGACTVHLDGEAVRSCQVSVGECAGRSVTTIEGLTSQDDSLLHVVQRAWLAEDVPQCGYCQAGQIMSAAAFLASAAGRIDDDAVDQAMAGNLCRCGTYPRIRRAIWRAARDMGMDARGASEGIAAQPPVSPADGDGTMGSSEHGDVEGGDAR